MQLSNRPLSGRLTHNDALAQLSAIAWKNLPKTFFIIFAVVFTTWLTTFSQRPAAIQVAHDTKRAQCLNFQSLLELDTETGELLSRDPNLVTAVEGPWTADEFETSVLNILRNKKPARAAHLNTIQHPGDFVPSLLTLFEQLLTRSSIMLYVAVPLFLHGITGFLVSREEHAGKLGQEALIRWRAEVMYCVMFWVSFAAYYFLVIPHVRWYFCLDVSGHVQGSLIGLVLLLTVISHQHEMEADSLISSCLWGLLMTGLNVVVLGDTVRFYHSDRDVLSAVGFCMVFLVVVMGTFDVLIQSRFGGSGRRKEAQN